MPEVTRDYERPVMVYGKTGFKRCWRDNSKNLVEEATPEQIAYLGVPPGVHICLDCALMVPEDFVLTEEMQAEVERRGAIMDWDDPTKEKFIPVAKDREKSFKKQVYRYDSEEYGCWK